MSKFTAKLYCGKQEIDSHFGNDVDALYIWMLTQVQGKFGDFSGSIVDNKTDEVVRSFRSSSGE